MQINYMLLTNNSIAPTRGSKCAAGWDLYSNNTDDIIINPKETVLISTGVSLAIPDGFFGGIYARSGLATKQGLRPANCTGVIDSDYRGEIKVPLYNDSQDIQLIHPNERIAQIIIQPYEEADYVLTDCLENTERGASGFGSTGV